MYVLLIIVASLILNFPVQIFGRDLAVVCDILIKASYTFTCSRR
jgi:hypothetical protein